MMVIGICGSPRVGGNTELLLKETLKVISEKGIETELITLSGKTIKPCVACRSCVGTKKCAINDDDFGSIFEKMLAADGIIFGTPVYFSLATGEMTSLLQRAGYVAKNNGGLLARKIGGAVVVARRAGHNFTFAEFLLWFMINGLIVPGSTYWNVAFGREKGEVMNDKEGLDTVRNFAENTAWLLNKIKG